ncbi:MAG: ParM/StbA family protein [Oxalobacter sp.]|nr:ParM/StbA family protein [Oxalobacter sp.]
MIIGIDHGNMEVKTASTRFTTGISTYSELPHGLSSYLEFRKKYYTLSNQRKPLEWRKAQVDHFYSLTLIGIARELCARAQYQPGTIPVELAVGLSPIYYLNQYQEFEKYLLQYGQKLDFVMDKRPFSIRINDVKSFSQGYAASMMTSLAQYYGFFFVIDIGGKVDISAVDNGLIDFSDKRNTSLDIGMVSLTNKIEMQLDSMDGLKIDERQIINTLSGKHSGIAPHYAAAMQETAKQHTGELFQQLREKDIDIRSAPSLYVGGGTRVLKKYLQLHVSKTTAFFLDDVHANAKGYERLYSLLR